jgi:hypothetical protein
MILRGGILIVIAFLQMKRNSVVKGVASFFGLGKKVQTEDSDDEPTGRK